MYGKSIMTMVLILILFATPSLSAQVNVTVSNGPTPTELVAKRFTFHIKIGASGGEADLGGVPNQQLFGAQVLLQNINGRNFDRRESHRAVVFPGLITPTLFVICGDGSQASQIKLDFTFVYQNQNKPGGSADFIHVSASRPPGGGQGSCDVGGQVDLIVLPQGRG